MSSLSRMDLVAWLRRQEAEHPVETWVYANWHAWPYLRISLAIRTRYGRTTRCSPVMAKMTQLFQILRKLWQMRMSRRPRPSTGGKDRAAEYTVVMLTHARRPVVVDGRAISPFAGVLMGWLRLWQIQALSVEAHCDPSLRHVPRPHEYCPWEDMEPCLPLPFVTQKPPWAETFRAMERELGVEPAFLQRLEAIEQRARFWRNYFRLHRTRLLFVTCWYDAPVVMPAVLAARQLGIPAVDIQHGFQDEYHEAYGGWTKAPPHGYELMPNVFWCWSQDRCREAENANPGLRHGTSYFAGGDLWLNHNVNSVAHGDRQLYERAVKADSAFSRTVLVCMCGNSLQHGVYPLLRSAIDHGPGDWHWMFRLHPADRRHRPQIEAVLGSPIRRHQVDFDFANDLSLYECVSLCDVMISDLSTCAQEALAFGKPCVIIDANGKNAYARPIAEGSMIYAMDKDIANAVSRALLIPKDVCLKSAEYFFASHETASRAVAEFLQNTLHTQLPLLSVAHPPVGANSLLRS